MKDWSEGSRKRLQIRNIVKSRGQQLRGNRSTRRLIIKLAAVGLPERNGNITINIGTDPGEKSMTILIDTVIEIEIEIITIEKVEMLRREVITINELDPIQNKTVSIS